MIIISPHLSNIINQWFYPVTSIFDSIRDRIEIIATVYIRDLPSRHQTGEVDFVIDGPGYTLPVEVKWGDSRNANLGALRRFIDEQDIEMGFTVNHSGVLEQDGKIVHIPSWLFCYLC